MLFSADQGSHCNFVLRVIALLLSPTLIPLHLVSAWFSECSATSNDVDKVHAEPAKTGGAP